MSTTPPVQVRQNGSTGPIPRRHATSTASSRLASSRIEAPGDQFERPVTDRGAESMAARGPETVVAVMRPVGKSCQPTT